MEADLAAFVVEIEAADDQVVAETGRKLGHTADWSAPRWRDHSDGRRSGPPSGAAVRCAPLQGCHETSLRRCRRLLPVAQNGDATTRYVSMGRPALRRHSPTVLTGVKRLRCAPVLADGLRPHLTPAPLRRDLQ